MKWISYKPGAVVAVAGGAAAAAPKLKPPAGAAAVVVAGAAVSPPKLKYVFFVSVFKTILTLSLKLTCIYP